MIEASAPAETVASTAYSGLIGALDKPCLEIVAIDGAHPPHHQPS